MAQPTKKKKKIDQYYVCFIKRHRLIAETFNLSDLKWCNALPKWSLRHYRHDRAKMIDVIKAELGKKKGFFLKMSELRNLHFAHFESLLIWVKQK